MGQGKSAEGKNLIKDCIKLLSVEQKRDTGNNRALYPVILVFLGAETKKFVSAVRETLEDNWNNAKFLKYLIIEKTTQGLIGYDSKKEEENTDIPAFIENAVVEMLETEEYVFDDKNRVKFEFFLCSEDENALDYYRFITERGDTNRYSVLKTLYLMMDESSKEKRKKTRELLAYITQHRQETKDELGTVYLLGNHLKNGSVLRNERLLLNYRLAADIILLGGNKGMDGQKALIRTVYQNDCIKTAAYALVEKNIRNITLTSLGVLMEGIKQQIFINHDSLEGQHIEYADDLKKRLGIRTDGIDCIEEIFKADFIKLFPRAEELNYIPYISEKDYKEIHKEKAVSWNSLNAKTGGILELFAKEAYEKPVERLAKDEVFREKALKRIYEEWISKIDYYDAVYGIESEKLERDIKEIKIVTPVRSGTLETRIHDQAVGRARVLFYENMKELLLQILEQIQEEGKLRSQFFEDICEEIKEEDFDDREQKKSIQKYYGGLVENFVKKDRNLAGDVLSLRNNCSEMSAAIKNAFKQLVKENSVYSYSFEQELEARLNQESAESRKLYVSNELESNIENYGRLHWNMFTYANQKRGTYYLINKNAEYAKKDLNPDSPEYSIFHLNRTDCIEKVAIYDLDPIGGYCNLEEMAGEA